MTRQGRRPDCRILSIEETGAGTILEVGGDDPCRVSTPSRPDRVAARRLMGCGRRADWVVLGLGSGGGSGGWSATLGTHTHSVPWRVRIPVPVALGLAEAGVPTFVSGVGS